MQRTTDQYQCERRDMKSFIAQRIPEDGTIIILADGEGGEIWADLCPIWDEEEGWDLYFETNEPDWVDLQEICEHFRQEEMMSKYLQGKKMTLEEWWLKSVPMAKRKTVKPKRHQPASFVNERWAATTLTVKEAALHLGISESFVYKMMSQGQLGYEMRGRRKLPTIESVAEYRRQNQVPACSGSSRPAKPPRTDYQFKYLFQRKKTRKDGN